jgi:hypothetical protein
MNRSSIIHDLKEDAQNYYFRGKKLNCSGSVAEYSNKNRFICSFGRIRT